MISVVVLRDGEIVEAAEISWRSKCFKNIIPKRDPDKRGRVGKLWFLVPERRAAFCRHANKMLNVHGSNKESLYGFFGIVGIADRWLKDNGVTWGLMDTEKEISVGDVPF